jgi:hypothetical protein
VFLVNPSGIVFGRGSSVSVGGLVASTLDIANDNFMPAGSQNKGFDKSEQLVFVGPSGSMAQVRVESGASIAATSPNGTVALLGGVVRNEGDISVARGSVGLVSASKVTLNLDFDGDGLTTFKIPADGQTTFKLAELQATDKSATAQLSNSGSVTADGGRVVLMAAAADVDARQLVVSQTGVIRARSLSTRNGEIVLDTGRSAQNTSEMLLGGTLDASASAAGVAGGSITARGDYIRMAGLNADASGASGGRVSVAGVAAVSMAPDAAISANANGANGANGAGGTVDIDAGRTHISGTISARGAGSGAGGAIGTSGGVLEVTDSAHIDAAGGAAGANGQWTASARSDLNVDNAAPAYDAAGYGTAGDTHVSASALGDALGRATDVRLRTASLEGETPDVVFQDNVAVVKSEGRDARLSVDSLRDVRMNNGSSITSQAGALHVDFDANAGNGELGGSIQLNGATIASNGGNIRFYGQGNADTGYAAGGVASVDGSPYSAQAAVTVSDSTLSTCAAASGGTACGGAGAIVLRGQGVSQDTGADPAYRISSDGVVVLGSTLATGAGNIAIDGKGGIAANGVRLGSTDSNDTTLRTATGDVTITGTSRGWTTDDPAAVYASRIETGSIGAPDVTVFNTAAVSMGSVTIAAGGRVAIDGTGGDIQGLTANSAFVTSAAAANGGTGLGFGPGDGVSISGGSITAGKGRDVSIAGTAGGNSFVVNNGGTVIQGQDVSAVQIRMEAGDTVRAEGGRVALDGRGGDVRVARVISRDAGPGLAPPAGAAVLDASSTTGAGGTVAITGRNVSVSDVYDDLSTIDAGGAGQAGTIDIRASNAIALDAQTSLRADAKSATGNGGAVNVIAGDTLRGYGSLSARGGASGGNGGRIETSSPHFELLGLRVDASAPVGTAGAWVIDPFNVNIAHGVASGSLPANPFDPLAASTVQDGDINNALDGGTSVTITTGTGGLAADGNITFAADAAIVRSKGDAALTFQLDAAHNISAFNTTTQIQSNAGALNVVFNAGVGGQGGAIGYGGIIDTNGGSVAMTANAGPTSGSAIALNGTRIDTRTTALGDAGPGGAVRITGTRTLPGTIVNTVPTVDLTGVSIQSSTGDIAITGTGQHGDGVRIQAGTGGPSQILSTGGDIGITGIGASYIYSTAPLSVQSVDITGATIRSVDGNIGIRGLVTPGPLDAPSGGVLVAGTTLVTTLGAGTIDIAGESQANGAGVTIGTGAQVNGNNTVVLRAANNGTTDALVVNGTVRAGSVLDLRPGGVDAAGNAVDRTANPITLGGTAATGFAVSAAELARLDAPTLVVGSNAHAGSIDVVGPLNVPGALTLQNAGGGGGIRLDGAVTAATLGLVSGGDITQTAAAPITAGTLLARSTGGSVLLDQAANNVSADTVGGGAAGAFRYVDVDTVKLGSVSVTGFDAASNTPQVVSATSMAAGTVFVRTLSGDLLLGTDVASTGGTDLVAGARFQNLGGYSITGAPWRVWADTWVGETRGGLRGSGLLPNLYRCTYGGLCAVSVSPGDNHFIYTQQPVATVVVNNASRPFGYPDPLFSYGIGGLILGDTGAGFAGFLFIAGAAVEPAGRLPDQRQLHVGRGLCGQRGAGHAACRTACPTCRAPTCCASCRQLAVRPQHRPAADLLRHRAAGRRPRGAGRRCAARANGRACARGPTCASCVDTEKRNGCADF